MEGKEKVINNSTRQEKLKVYTRIVAIATDNMKETYIVNGTEIKMDYASPLDVLRKLLEALSDKEEEMVLYDKRRYNSVRRIINNNNILIKINL